MRSSNSAAQGSGVSTYATACSRRWTLKRKRSPVGIVSRYAWWERPRGQRSTSAPAIAPPEISSAARATSSDEGGTVTVRSTTARLYRPRTRAALLRRERERELRGDARVRAQERDVRLERASLCGLAERTEEERRERRAADAPELGLIDRARDGHLDLAPVERRALRERHCEDHARAARELLARDPHRAEHVVHAMRERETARAHVERRQLVRAEADDGDTERLETLEREREVEHELRPGAH